MSTVDTQETNVQLARDDLTVIMTMVASLRFKKTPELEDKFPFGIRVIRTTMCDHISL